MDAFFTGTRLALSWRRSPLVAAAAWLLFGTAVPGGNGWCAGVEASGDFRYRIEYIDLEDAETQYRSRIRARLGVEGTVTEGLDLVFRIASGGDSPISTNQTLDGGFSSKAIWLDLAYLDWHPEFAGGTHAYAGKMKNPFRRPGGSELLWDSDLTLEGMAATWGGDLGKVAASVAGGAFCVEERSADDDSRLFGGQAVVGVPLPGAGMKVSGGASYYLFTESKDFPTFYDDTDGFGNSVASSGGRTLYLYDYQEVEPFVEVSLSVGSVPVLLFADGVINLGVDVADDEAAEDLGWLIGASVGGTKKRGDWQLQGSYRELRRDAVIGAFTSSDFGGGGTDVRGFQVGWAYQIARNVTLAATYYANEIGIAPGETGVEHQRVQLDLQTKF
jgi:hypothetical protein